MFSNEKTKDVLVSGAKEDDLKHIEKSESDKNTIRVLIADDYKLVRDCIATSLNRTPGISVVGKAISGEEAVQLADKYNPDVILMDVHMPGIGGIGAINLLLRRNSSTKILILTVYNSDIYSKHLIGKGISGYITKQCSIKELAHAIRSVHNGEQYLYSEIVKKLALNPMKDKGNQSIFGALSERELQVMMMLAEGKRQKDIATTINISPKTVGTYRSRLFKKLRIDNYAELVNLKLKDELSR